LYSLFNKLQTAPKLAAGVEMNEQRLALFEQKGVQDTERLGVII
jgi:hypothetical protein